MLDGLQTIKLFVLSWSDVYLIFQQRTVQETVLFKDEQLREAQTWIQRAQELDAFHANANNSLHAELRDRTEQLNQIWLGQQRQV